jgi:hypothetical protein
MADEQTDETEESRPQQGDGPPPKLNYALPGTVGGAGAMKLVTLATFGQAWEAHLACGKLESAGIPAVIADENIVTAGGGLYTNMTGGIKLQVPAVDVERAAALLPRRVRNVVVKCPRCGSTDTRQVEFSPGLKALFLVMLGIPYLFVDRPWVCLDCSTVWKRPADADADDDEDQDDDEGDDNDKDDDDEEEQSRGEDNRSS